MESRKKCQNFDPECSLRYPRPLFLTILLLKTRSLRPDLFFLFFQPVRR